MPVTGAFGISSCRSQLSGNRVRELLVATLSSSEAATSFKYLLDCNREFADFDVRPPSKFESPPEGWAVQAGIFAEPTESTNPEFSPGGGASGLWLSQSCCATTT